VLEAPKIIYTHLANKYDEERLAFLDSSFPTEITRVSVGKLEQFLCSEAMLADY